MLARTGSVYADLPRGVPPRQVGPARWGRRKHSGSTYSGTVAHRQDSRQWKEWRSDHCANRNQRPGCARHRCAARGIGADTVKRRVERGEWVQWWTVTKMRLVSEHTISARTLEYSSPTSPIPVRSTQQWKPPRLNSGVSMRSSQTQVSPDRQLGLVVCSQCDSTSGGKADVPCSALYGWMAASERSIHHHFYGTRRSFVGWMISVRRRRSVR